MKAIHLTILYMLIFMSCTGAKKGNGQLNENNHAKLRDTVFIKVDSSIVSESIYLYLDSIKFGDPFTDKNNIYGYYRLLFTSSEEMQDIYVEKINIVGDGIVKLEKRFKLSPEMFNNKCNSSIIDFVNWETPKVIKVEVCSTVLHVDLTSIKCETNIS